MNVVHAYRGISVVYDVERAALVFESYCRKIGFFRASNVNRRLFFAVFAGSIVRIQVAPVFGPSCSFVAPWCLPGRGHGLGVLRLRILTHQKRRNAEQDNHHPNFSQMAPRSAPSTAYPDGQVRLSSLSDLSPQVCQSRRSDDSSIIKVCMSIVQMWVSGPFHAHCLSQLHTLVSLNFTGANKAGRMSVTASLQAASFACPGGNRPGSPFPYVNQTFSSNKFPGFVFEKISPLSPGSSKKEPYY